MCRQAQFGDEEYFVVDFTEGGAPIGLTMRELREMEAVASEVQSSRQTRARRAIEGVVAAAASQARIEVGRVTWLGEGLSRDGWRGDVVVQPDPQGLSGSWVALLPRPDADPDLADRVEVEHAVLRWLGGRPRRFRTPRVLGLAEEPSVLVQEWVPGLALDDLAIVTRGARRPFKRADGLERLLEAYEAGGGLGVKAQHVRIHELGILAGWASQEGAPVEESPFGALARRLLS